MGYVRRSFYAINDLTKLIHYKTKRGISLKWQTKAYSYLNTFRKNYGLDPIEPPNQLPPVKVSIKATNEGICQDLGITSKIADKLDLKTLRLDAEQIRKRRYNAGQGLSSRAGYFINCKHHFLQQRAIIEDLLKKGMNKTAIANKLGISRKHVHQILNRQEEGIGNGNKTK